jgi:hypothetical protein
MSATGPIRQDVAIPKTRGLDESSAEPGHGSDGYVPSRARHTELTSVAWVADGELSYDEWLRRGRRLGVAGRSAAWWIGDWVRYGAARYGRRYELATRVTRYEHQTLLNMVYVATRFEISRRRENVSWSHHAELAALAVEEQERWLDRATAQRLTVRRLRCELVAARQPVDIPARNRAVATNRQAAPARDSPLDADGLRQREDLVSKIALPRRVVTCPKCGHHFMESTTVSEVASRRVLSDPKSAKRLLAPAAEIT